MATDLDVSPATVSRITAAKPTQGIAEPLALKLIELAGLDAADFGLGSPASSRRPRSILGARPAWAEAEAVARRLYPHLDESSWEGARHFSTSAGISVTPDVIVHLALAVEASARKAS